MRTAEALIIHNENEIRLRMFLDFLGCLPQQMSFRNELLQYTKCPVKKQHRTSRNVTYFPQKNKNKNITTMEYFL